MGLDKVVGFKTGGVVGGKTPTLNTSGVSGGGNVSASVVVNVNGGDGEKNKNNGDAGKLANLIKGNVLQTLQSEMKPGGLLGHIKKK
jgi:hypothetical protein